MNDDDATTKPLRRILIKIKNLIKANDLKEHRTIHNLYELNGSFLNNKSLVIRSTNRDKEKLWIVR